jgi:predicted acyltransferase
MLVLGLVMWAVDVHGKAGPLTFFNVFGRNPLLAYITSEVGAVTIGMIMVTGLDGAPQSLYGWTYAHAAVPLAGDTAAGSFLFAVGFMLVNWLFAWACYRRGVILKV